MKGRVTTIFVLHGVSVLIVLGLAASQENKLFAEIRDRVSNYASFVSSRNLSCSNLLSTIETIESDHEDYCSIINATTSTPETTSLLLFNWPPANAADKDTRCFCALSVFQLMVSTSLSSSDTFCTSSTNDTFACLKECDIMEYFNDTLLNLYANQQCVVKATKKHITRFMEKNTSVVVAFNGLSCEAIQIYREDICDVVYNIDSGGESTTITTDDSEGAVIVAITIAAIILGVIVSLITIIVIITLIFCYINRKRKNEIKNLKSFEAVNSPSVYTTQQSLENPVYAFPAVVACSNDYSNNFMNEFKKQHESRLIMRNGFKIVSELGQGAFGIVYKGVTANSGMEIAIKTLKDNSTLEETKEFMSEATVMAEFKHPNIMTLLGLCVEDDDNTIQPMILLPYMVNGDLKSFLVSSRIDNGVEKMPENLSLHKLETMCLNIADGMKYLAELKYVHRDLAARNCMIDEHLNVKVADFGFTRDIYGVEYYRLSRKTKLPVKWMAPESLLDNVYNEWTDVWAFGVTCWEVYSLGRAPYPGVDNSEIPDYVKNGNKLRKPCLCPNKMYSTITRCWSNDPNQRPLFNDLVYIIENVSKDSNDADGYMALNHQYFQLDSGGVNPASYEEFVTIQDAEQGHINETAM